MRRLQLKLILLFRSVPNDDSKLRELLERFGLIERFTPYVSGGRGLNEKRRSKGVAGEVDETRRSLKQLWRSATLAMLAAIVAAVRS